jgi:hypothetical protein
MVNYLDSLGHAAGRLGEYMVTKDIAEGTFGTVKSKPFGETPCIHG